MSTSNFLNGFRFDPEPTVRIRYDLKIMAIDGQPLATPIFISDHWGNFGVQEYGSAQLLIDELARALNQNELEKAQGIYTQLSEEHIVDLDSYDFNIEQLNITRKPQKPGGMSRESNVLNSWSSAQLQQHTSVTK